MFKSAYNVIANTMNTVPKTEIVKLESNIILNSQLKKCEGSYFQILSKNRYAPLFIALSHDDQSFLGIQIFWSRKNKYPYMDDCEGVFNASSF